MRGATFRGNTFLICFFEAIYLITPTQDVTETASVCPYLRISPGFLLPIIRDIYEYFCSGFTIAVGVLVLVSNGLSACLFHKLSNDTYRSLNGLALYTYFSTFISLLGLVGSIKVGFTGTPHPHVIPLTTRSRFSNTPIHCQYSPTFSS